MANASYISYIGEWTFGDEMAASRFRAEKIAAASLMLGLVGVAQVPVAAGQGATPPESGAAGAQRPQTPPASAPANSTLDILEFDVDGNTVLDEVTIDDAVYPFLGPQRTREDVDRARAALEKAYTDHGYKTVAVIIPRQTVVQGVVHLQVAEGRVGHLKVVGSRYSSIVRLKQQTPSLAEGSVPNFNDMQRELTQLNQTGDRTVTPALRAGTAPGTIDVDLLVQDHLPLHATAEVNNQYSQDTTHLRVIGTLSYDNLFQEGQSLTVSYQAAPQNEADARVIYASYLVPLGDSPFKLLIDGFHSGTNVAAAGGTDVVGKGTIGEVKALLTLRSSATSYQAVTLGVSYKHFDDDTQITSPQSPGGSQGFTTPVTYFPVTAGYSGLWRGASGATQVDLTASFANPGFGSPGFPNPGGLTLNRAQTPGQELYLRANFSRTQDLPLGFQGYLRLSGQVSDQPLVSNEEFTIGGASSVRGYVEAEALGDRGVSGTLELRSPQLARGALRHVLQDFHLFGFGDRAQVYVLDPIVDAQTSFTQPSKFTLASAGAGGNVQAFNYLNGSLTYARTFREGPVTPRGKNVVLFRAWVAF